MSLPAQEDQGMTRILQDLGTLMFKVDKKHKPHFRVETPVIAAVVKGTTFTVTAGPDTHTVHVAEGLVEVTSLKSDESVYVPAGETVRVSTADSAFIDLNAAGRIPGKSDEAPADASKSNNTNRTDLLIIPSNIGAEPLDYAGLTDGLVRAGVGGDIKSDGGVVRADIGGDIESAAL